VFTYSKRSTTTFAFQPEKKCAALISIKIRQYIAEITATNRIWRRGNICYGLPRLNWETNRVRGLLLSICVLGAVVAATPDAVAAGNNIVRADKVVVLKAARRLLLFRGDEILASFRVALGRNPKGKKTRQGDGRTPEGRYVLRSDPAN